MLSPMESASAADQNLHRYLRTTTDWRLCTLPGYSSKRSRRPAMIRAENQTACVGDMSAMSSLPKLRSSAGWRVATSINELICLAAGLTHPPLNAPTGFLTGAAATTVSRRVRLVWNDRVVVCVVGTRTRDAELIRGTNDRDAMVADIWR